ncbi:hypothetical protein ACUXQE_002688 [Staphylococcus saprophyticus]|uniref:hypothetical protein n=1 Tax=Staphylococcus saprophyticus TaxID=29385 RepID=UPI001597FE72|nr:hypothetical protein [Staphylococcus saprophyticus]MDH5170073.1 hypothetical protein [Staphylococcus cohnii]MDW3893747.1 hypothetical protein [Staphylococcus saprophyticus]QKV12614.1 hypothetical protein HSZ48_13070 [Staphylococcus saprophyticus]
MKQTRQWLEIILSMEIVQSGVNIKLKYYNGKFFSYTKEYRGNSDVERGKMTKN